MDYNFDEKTRNAAQVLTAALALSAPTAGGEEGLEIAAQYHDTKAARWRKEAKRHERSNGRRSDCKDRDNQRAMDHERFAEDLRAIARLHASPPSSGSGEGVEQCEDDGDEILIRQLRGRALFLREREKAKTPDLLEEAAHRLAALKSPAVEWQPRIGDPVQVSESCPYSADWKRTRLWVAGLSIKRGSNDINVSVCESWPPSSDGYTDGFYIGRRNKHDDLIPGHPLTQGSGS